MFNKNDVTRFYKIVLTFFSIISFRALFDAYSYSLTSDGIFLWEHYIHVLTYFSSIFLSFSLMLHFFSKQKFLQTLELVAKQSPVILIVPIIDFFLKSDSPFYVTVNLSNIISTFFSEINPFSNKGITTGIYIAGGISLILFAIFTYKKTRDILRSFLVFPVGYLIFYIYSILPSLLIIFKTKFVPTNLALLEVLNNSWLGDISRNMNLNTVYELVMARIFFVLILFQIALVIFISNKKLWLSLKGNLRTIRIINYLLIGYIGAFISQKINGDINILNPINLVTLACTFSVVALNAWLAALVNDEEDIKIDTISSPSRPLINQELSIEDYSIIKKIIIILLCVGALTINLQIAFIALLGQCAFYIYSAEPLKLKRNFIFSSILIGITTMLSTLGGYILVAPDKSISSIPMKIIFFVGLTYALLSSVKDLKDYEGDKNENIKTIPVVFGIKKARIIIALLYAFIFLLIPYLLSLPQLYIFAICASIFVFYLLAKGYHEKYIFYMKFLYMIVLFYFVK